MKATELRIGNILKLKMAGDGKYPDEIRPIKASEIFALSNHLEWATPIPLTEDWLLKFGLNIKEEIWFSKKTNIAWIRFEVSIKDKRCILYDTKEIIYCDMLFPKSVHQLQNLYFALTGEELTIK